MIKRIRVLCIVLFVLSAAAYGGVSVHRMLTTDTTGPTIHMDTEEITLSVEDDTAAVLEGVTAQDAEDGDVTDLLVVESISNFITDGARDATIAAFDAAGNVTKATRRITYSDYTAPTVALSGPLAASVSDTSTLLDVITVTDCLDGDLTNQVQLVFDNNAESVEAGEFPMHIQVSNSAGDTLDLPVTVRFYNASEENSAAQITLSDYLIYVKQGTQIDPLDYLEEMTLGRQTYLWRENDRYFLLDGENPWEQDDPTISLSDLDIDNGVDRNTPGAYEVTYRYEDEDSGVTGTTRLVVVVKEG